MRWSQASLAKLGGAENIVIKELLFGEDFYADINFTTDSDTTVGLVNHTNKTIVVHGNYDIFSVGDYISFSCSNTLYQILDIKDNVFTLDSLPTHSITSHRVELPRDLTGALFEFKLRKRTAIVQDTRQGIDIVSMTAIDPAIEITADVLTDIIGKSLVNGQIRVSLPEERISDLVIPTSDPETGEVVMLTGYLQVTLPVTGNEPSQKLKTRYCIVYRTDGFIV
jgi:hypothetical protein